MTFDIKTYIMHCKRLTDRFVHMNEQLHKHEFTDVVWYTNHDAEDQVGQDLTGVYAGVRPEVWNNKVKVGGWSNPGSHMPRHLTNGEISIATKWGNVIREIAEGDEEYALVLEDDVILCDDFCRSVSHYMKSTPPDWDVIYLGNGANLHPPNIQEGKLAYKVNHPASRCADSILLRKEAAAKLNEEYFPFDIAADFEIGYLQAKHDLNVYWWEPTLCTQGSESGAFKSSLR